MAKKRTLEDCYTGSDFVSYVDRHPDGRAQRCKNGNKLYGPNPGVAIVHSNHPKPLADGTRHALIKKLLALGLVLMPLACLISAVLS